MLWENLNTNVADRDRRSPLGSTSSARLKPCILSLPVVAAKRWNVAGLRKFTPRKSTIVGECYYSTGSSRHCGHLLVKTFWRSLFLLVSCSHPDPRGIFVHSQREHRGRTSISLRPTLSSPIGSRSWFELRQEHNSFHRMPVQSRHIHIYLFQYLKIYPWEYWWG